MHARIGGEAGEPKGEHDHANGGPNRKLSQDASMNLKQLSIEIMEMSGMGIKQTGGMHNQITRVILYKQNISTLETHANKRSPQA